MPNRELNDPMEKSNEIAHVNAELIPLEILLKVMIRHSPAAVYSKPAQRRWHCS